MKEINLIGQRFGRLKVLAKSGRNKTNHINDSIRKSVEFKLWRESVFARDNWTCQECGQKGVYLHPHHLQSFSKYPEYRFNLGNGITLCRSCHARRHASVNFVH